jgi:hypothetical protein
MVFSRRCRENDVSQRSASVVLRPIFGSQAYIDGVPAERRPEAGGQIDEDRKGF